MFADDVEVHPMEGEFAPSVVYRNLVVLQQYFLLFPVWDLAFLPVFPGLQKRLIFDSLSASDIFVPSSRATFDLASQASFENT